MLLLLVSLIVPAGVHLAFSNVRHLRTHLTKKPDLDTK